MKLVANLLVAIHNVASAEAMVLGMKAGLDPAQNGRAEAVTRIVETPLPSRGRGSAGPLRPPERVPEPRQHHRVQGLIRRGNRTAAAHPKRRGIGCRCWFLATGQGTGDPEYRAAEAHDAEVGWA